MYGVETMSDTQAGRILKLLQVAGDYGVANHKLAEISLQYNARIFDLRHRHGHDIRKRRVYYGTRPSETFMYYLVKPKAPKPRPVAEATTKRPEPTLFRMDPVRQPQRMFG